MPSRRILVAALVVLLACSAYAALDVAGSRAIARRLENAIAASATVRGDVADVDACPACAAYRVRGLTLRPADDGEASSLLVAPELDAGLDFGALLGARLSGGVALRGAELQLPVGRVQEGGGTALDVPWRDIGAGLLPVPVGRVAVREGALVVRHAGFAEPIVWRFAGVSADAVRLAGTPGPATVRATGRTPGDGRFELHVELASASDAAGDGNAGRFALRAALHDVPLAALRGYLEQVAGLGVEGGSLDARFDVEGTREGWRGHVDCEIAGLDVFDPSDLAEGPGRALWDAVGGAVSTCAALRDAGPLRVRLELEQRLGEPEVDVWRVLARLLREALLAPFVRPLEALGNAAVDAATEPTEGSEAPTRSPTAADGGDRSGHRPGTWTDRPPPTTRGSSRCARRDARASGRWLPAQGIRQRGDHHQHEEDHEEDPGDLHRDARDAAEAERAGDERQDEERDGPTEHGNLLSRWVSRRARRVPADAPRPPRRRRPRSHQRFSHAPRRVPGAAPRAFVDPARRILRTERARVTPVTGCLAHATPAAPGRMWADPHRGPAIAIPTRIRSAHRACSSLPSEAFPVLVPGSDFKRARDVPSWLRSALVIR